MGPVLKTGGVVSPKNSADGGALHRIKGTIPGVNFYLILNKSAYF